MASLKEQLRTYEQQNGPIKVGLVGAGQMGTGLMSQMEKMVGMKVFAVADVIPGRSKEAYIEAGVSPESIFDVEDNVKKANEYIEDHHRVVTTSSEFLCQINSLDIIVEATGVPEIGTQVCNAAIEAGKDIVNMNVETDATIGYYLGQKAKKQV